MNTRSDVRSATMTTEDLYHAPWRAIYRRLIYGGPRTRSMERAGSDVVVYDPLMRVAIFEASIRRSLETWRRIAIRVLQSRSMIECMQKAWREDDSGSDSLLRDSRFFKKTPDGKGKIKNSYLKK